MGEYIQKKSVGGTEVLLESSKYLVLHLVF